MMFSKRIKNSKGIQQVGFYWENRAVPAPGRGEGRRNGIP